MGNAIPNSHRRLVYFSIAVNETGESLRLESTSMKALVEERRLYLDKDWDCSEVRIDDQSVQLKV